MIIENVATAVKCSVKRRAATRQRHLNTSSTGEENVSPDEDWKLKSACPTPRVTASYTNNIFCYGIACYHDEQTCNNLFHNS